MDQRLKGIFKRSFILSDLIIDTPILNGTSKGIYIYKVLVYTIAILLNIKAFLFCI